MKLGDAFEIVGTGNAQITGGEFRLNGGPAGLGAMEQDIATTDGRRYRLTFRVRQNPVAVQIGSSSESSNILAEGLYPLTDAETPEHVVDFTATSGTTWIGFRSNQPVVSVVDNVSVKLLSAAGWRDEDVGKYVYLNGGLVHILRRVDATKVVGECLIALSTDDAAPPGAWSLEAPAWSDALGWPETVMLQDGRLIFRGTATFPQTQWHSEVDGLFNFARGVLPDDAVVLHLTQAGGNITLNRTAWILPGDRIFVGTSDAEYGLIGADDNAITPTNPPKVRQGSVIGSALVEPLLTGRSILMVGKGGAQLWELQFNLQTEHFDTRELTIIAEHLIPSDTTIMKLAYAATPLSLVWVLLSDGTLLGMTYDLVENVTGWFRIETQGEIEDVLCLPHNSQAAMQVYVMTVRVVHGQHVRSIEYFQAYHPVHVGTGQVGCTLDAASIQISAGPVETITGLGYLEGATVEAVGDGGYFAPLTVVGGQVTLANACTVVQVGLPFTARMTALPVDLPQTGTVRTKQKRWVLLMAELFHTLGLKLNGERLQFLQHGMPENQGLPIFTGVKEMMPLGWDRTGAYTIEADLPFPATVLAMYGELSVEAG